GVEAVYRAVNHLREAVSKFAFVDDVLGGDGLAHRQGSTHKGQSSFFLLASGAAGQVLPEAVHDAEDLFRRFLIVGDLDSEAAGLRDGLDKEAGGNVGGHAKLARFEHDVPEGAPAGIFQLRAIESQQADVAVAVANFESVGDEPVTN